MAPRETRLEPILAGNRNLTGALSIDYSDNVMGYCLEVEAEERDNRTAETTTSTSMPSIPDVTESEHPTTSTTDPEPTTLAPSEPSNPSEPSEPSEAKVSETNGLSAGAKGGIAAGVVLGVAALVLLAFFLFRRHRKKPLAAQESAAAGSEKGDNSSPAELGGEAVLPDIRKNTTDDPYIAELDVGPATQIYPERFSELDGMSIPRGLPVPEDTGGGTAVVKSSDGPTPH